MSTIEAIAHAATAAGASSEVQTSLLTLFELQRLRVFKGMQEDGHRKPRAVAVGGTEGSLGDWTCIPGYYATSTSS